MACSALACVEGVGLPSEQESTWHEARTAAPAWGEHDTGGSVIAKKKQRVGKKSGGTQQHALIVSTTDRNAACPKSHGRISRMGSNKAYSYCLLADSMPFSAHPVVKQQKTGPNTHCT